MDRPGWKELPVRGAPILQRGHMITTKSMEEFYQKNDSELRAFVVSRIGFFDKDILNDLVQNIYTDLISLDSLAKFDPEAGMSFSSYIFKVASWRLSQDATINSKRIDVDMLEAETNTLQETLDNYINFLNNSGVSCTGLYQITEYLRMRADEGLSVTEVPREYTVAHREALRSYRYYDRGLTGPLAHY